MSDRREYVIRWADGGPDLFPTRLGTVEPNGCGPGWYAGANRESARGVATADEAERALVADWTTRGAEVYRLDWTTTPPSLVRVT